MAKKRLKNQKSIFPLLSIFSVVACIIRNPIISFAVGLLIWIFILANAGISFFTEVSFILLFSYLQAVMHKVVGITGSTLAWAGIEIPFYFDDLTIATLSFLLILLAFCMFSKLVQYEKTIYKKQIKLKQVSGLIILLLAMLFIIAIFPSLPTMRFSEGGRARNESLPYGLVLFSLALCAITFDSCKKRKWYLLVYSFIVLWIFGHGERVEVLGFLSYAGIKYLNNYDFAKLKGRILDKRKRRVYLGGLIAVVLAMWIGMSRRGAGGITFSKLIYNIIVQPTCGDVVYCFNCAADMWHTGNGLLGYTYLDYPLQLLPFSIGNFSPPVLLIREYGTMGGGLFFTEPMMNFGIIGVVITNVLFCAIMYFFLKNSTRLKAWMWVPIVIEVFRICWYGRSVWIFAVFVEIPIAYFGTKWVLNKV